MYKIDTKWSKGNIITPDGDIGQLTINKNEIKFHLQGHGDIFPCNFVGQGDHKYKIFTYGQQKSDSNGFFYKVSKAFLYNGSDYDNFSGDFIENIQSFSFEIPELTEWLKIPSVKFTCIEDETVIIHELETPIIVLKETEPKIYIKYEIKDLLKNMDNYGMTLRKTPRIFVEFTNPQDDTAIFSSIETVMRFFSLFIGRISTADDIKLDILGKDLKMWLFINHDFSINEKRNAYWARHRTAFENIREQLQQWFENWYSFTNNSSFKFLQDAYFQISSKKTWLIEDIFLTYCRFLEGYDLRVSKDEETANSLEEQLKEVLKDTSISEKLKPIFNNVGSKYKYQNVAKWISSGFLSRISLDSRIKRIDETFFCVLASNSKSIIKENSSTAYYSKIVKTRNFYSHFKPDSLNTLNINELYSTLPLMEILIISILFSEIGVDKEIVKGFLVHDEVFWPYVTHLRTPEQHN
jgi:predicted RNA-binding protein with PIN domain